MNLTTLLKLITSDTKILVIFEGSSIIKPCDYPKYKGLKVVKLRLFKNDDTLRVYIGNISAWSFITTVNGDQDDC